MEIFRFGRKVWRILSLYGGENVGLLRRMFFSLNYFVVVLGLIGFIALSGLYLVEYFMDKSQMEVQFALYILMQISLDLAPLGTLFCAAFTQKDIKKLVSVIQNILKQSESNLQYDFDRKIQFHISGLNENSHSLYEEAERRAHLVSKWPGIVLFAYFLCSQLVANVVFLIIDYRNGGIDSSKWYYQMHLQ